MVIAYRRFSLFFTLSYQFINEQLSYPIQERHHNLITVVAADYPSILIEEDRLGNNVLVLSVDII